MRRFFTGFEKCAMRSGVMLKRTILFVFMVGVNLLGASLALAQMQPSGQEPISTTVTSPSRAFIIRGPVIEQNAHMAHWAEKMSGRIEGALGLSIPALTRQPVILQLVDLEDGQLPSVRKSQKLVGPRIQQTLWIHGIEGVDHEEMLEAFSSMMIQRTVWSRTRFRGEKLKQTRVPDWFSAGLAQTLLPQLRSRNHDQVYRSWLNNEVLSAEETVQYRFAAEGRWMEKFSCGIFVEWILSVHEVASVLDNLMRTWALGEQVNEDVLSAFMGFPPGGRVLEEEWDLWLSYMTRRKSDWQAKQEATVEELAQLTLTTSAGQSLALDRLVEYVGEPWLRKGVVNLRYAIQTLGVGQSREFLDVVAMYIHYLNTIEAMATSSKKWLRRRPTPSEALSEYQQAKRALDQFARVLGQRSQYLAEHQKKKALQNGARPNGLSSPVDPVYKSYLDRFDVQAK